MSTTTTTTEQARKKGRGNGGESIVLKLDTTRPRARREVDKMVKQAFQKIRDEEEEKKADARRRANDLVEQLLAEGDAIAEERRRARRQATTENPPVTFLAPFSSQTQQAMQMNWLLSGRMGQPLTTTTSNTQRAKVQKARQTRLSNTNNFKRENRERLQTQTARQIIIPSTTTTQQEVQPSTTERQEVQPPTIDQQSTDDQVHSAPRLLQTLPEPTSRDEAMRPRARVLGMRSTFATAGEVGRQVLLPIVRGVGVAALQATVAGGLTAAIGVGRLGQGVVQTLGTVASSVSRKRKVQQDDYIDEYDYEHEDEEQADPTYREYEPPATLQGGYEEQEEEYPDPRPSTFQRMADNLSGLASRTLSASSSAIRTLGSAATTSGGRISANTRSLVNSLSEIMTENHERVPYPEGAVIDEFTGQLLTLDVQSRQPMDEFTGQAVPGPSTSQYQDLRNDLLNLRRQLDSRMTDVQRDIAGLTTDMDTLAQMHDSQREATDHSLLQMNESVANLTRRVEAGQADLTARTNALQDLHTYTQDMLNDIAQKSQIDDTTDDAKSESVRKRFDPDDPDDDPSDDGERFRGGQPPTSKRDMLISGRNTVIPSFDINVGIQLSRPTKKGRRPKPPRKPKKPARGKERLDVTQIL